MASELFRFAVGPQRREFTIHSALVARQSPALDTLVNGAFAEARNKHAALESVDEETFALFTRYAYSGNYDLLAASAWPETRRREIEKTREWGKNLFEPYNDTYAPRARSGRLGVLWTRFKTIANRFKRSGFYPDHKGDDMNSQADIFRRHAKMYIFADCYGISDLMNLALNNLGERLITFELSDETVGDILDLLRYCDDAAVPGELKSFVFLYAASQADTLWRSPDFRECVLQSRELTTALFTQVLEAPDSVQTKKDKTRDGDNESDGNDDDSNDDEDADDDYHTDEEYWREYNAEVGGYGDYYNQD